jgi:tRNA dimethylallyltransferase
MPKPPMPLPIYIAGPTASGKSLLALELARRLSGEIISVDSMQVYIGMDIGTAKPTKAEQQQIPHHLIDVVSVTQQFDAAKFVELAQKAEREIRQRGNLPIYCGGTGLYFNALIHGLGSAPPSDSLLRQELEQTPLQLLLQELKAKDPLTFEQIDRHNPRRIIRAVEVIRLTNKPFSQSRSSWQGAPPPGVWIGLSPPRPLLAQRINARVDDMFQAGLVEETRRLLQQGLLENKTALQALGYRQVVDFLQGNCSLDTAREQTKIKTRQFAKRQLTWFRRQLSLFWLEPGSQTLDQVLGLYHAGLSLKGK